MELYENNDKTYIIDNNGIMYFIADRKVKRRIISEDDWKYNRWEQYNLNQAYKGGEPIECYEEFLVDVLDCVLTAEESIILEEYKKQQGHAKYMKSKTELDTFIRDNLGGFYFSIYNKLLELSLAPQYRFRFIFLCTHINYDGKLEYGNGKGDSRLMIEKDLGEVLMLKEEETRKTKKALIESDLITIEDDKTITINKKYAVKGKIGKRDLKGSIRMMEQGIQELYAKATPKEHKKLALLVEILPYVNFQHNIVCNNPNESSAKNVIPITLTELANMLGYSTTQKLKRGLMDIKINNESLIMIVTINRKSMIIVNPRVYYKGNNIDALKGIINLFTIADK